MSFLDNNKDINNEINTNPINNNNNNNSNIKLLINDIQISQSIIKKEKNINKSNHNKINKRNVTINLPFNSRSTKKFRKNINNIKEEEKNNSNNISKINVNKSSLLEIKLKQNQIKKKLNFIHNDNIPIRTNNKTYTLKKLTSNDYNKNNLDKEKDFNYKKFKRLNTINPNNNHIKSTPKPFNKKLLFSKLKDLLEEIENEKNNNNKDNKNKKKKKLKDISYLFLERSVKPIIPNLKNRAQLNKYLINDFKENESYQEYIKRSLKYKKINENYETAQMLQKEANQYFILNEVPPPATDHHKEKENYIPKNSSTMNNLNNSIRYKKKNNFKYITPNTQYGTYMQKKRSAISNKNRTEGSSYKSLNSKNFSNNVINDYKNKMNDIKRQNSKKYNLFFSKEEKQKDNNNNNNDNNDSFLENEFLTERPKKNIFRKNTVNFSSEKALIKQKNSFIFKHKKHPHRHKKHILVYDKFTLSNNIYNEHKRYFDDYLMNKRIIRSKNFSEQMSNLAKEKDLYGNNVEESGHLPKLKEGSLIYQMRLKNLFKNSFNPMANFKEGDDDLDLDNLKKIKASVMETEIEMFTSLKNEINPKYIKSKFNKTTIGKYHSTRGVYFGSK